MSSVEQEGKVVFRQLSFRDLDDIVSICKQKDNFTIPSSYTFWMLLQTQQQLCQALELDNKIVAYFLVLNTNRRKEIFIWQLGILNHAQHHKHFIEFCKYYLGILRANRVSRVSYTSFEHDAKLIIYILKSVGLKGHIN